MKKLIVFIILGLSLGCGKSKLKSKSGSAGKDGSNCSVEQVREGALIKCEDGSKTLLTHGQDGVDGRNGIDGVDGIDGQDGVDGQDALSGMYSIIEIIDPCGNESGMDQLIFRLSDGSLVGTIRNKAKEYTSFLLPGWYETIDGTKCEFYVDNDLVVSW